VPVKTTTEITTTVPACDHPDCRPCSIPDPPSNPLAGLAAIEQGFGNEFAEQVVGYFIFGTPFTDDGSFSGSAMSLRIMENATNATIEYRRQLNTFVTAKRKLVKP
jgi:hypothetical protein